MILNKLESGLLLFDTPQGYVAVEPSFRERVYLLWTFRNFRQLSLPLLNARQIALVKDLAGKNTAAKMERYDALRVIGVVENFSLPRARASALPAATTAMGMTAVSAMPSVALPDEREFLVVGEQELAIAAEQEPVVVPQFPLQQSESVLFEEREIVGAGLSAKFAESMQAFWGLTATGLEKLKSAEFKVRNLAKSTLAKLSLVKHNLPKFSLAKFKRATGDASIVDRADAEGASLGAQKANLGTFSLAPTRLATAAGVIAICLGTVAAWHQIGGVLGSEAHDHAQVRADAAVQTNFTYTQPTVAKTASVVETANNPVVPEVQPKQRAGDNEELASIAPIAPATDVATVHDQNAALPARKIAHRGIVSTTKLPLATIESGIQATRPPLRFVYPRHSDSSARGVVALTADVDASGAVRSVRVVKGNRSLAAAAISAVRKWRYRPYLKDGHPVATETNIVFSFFSDEAITMSFPPSVGMAR